MKITKLLTAFVKGMLLGALIHLGALLKMEEAICEELGDRAGLQRSYGNQASILWQQGEKEAAREKMRAARNGFAALGMVRKRDMAEKHLKRMGV